MCFDRGYKHTAYMVGIVRSSYDNALRPMLQDVIDETSTLLA